jgi:hypothetical protein
LPCCQSHWWASWSSAICARGGATTGGILDPDEQRLFDEDLAKARAAMDRAWLETMPVRPAGRW